jgi:hypothetical protein
VEGPRDEKLRDVVEEDHVPRLDPREGVLGVVEHRNSAYQALAVWWFGRTKL